jgi:hypothetical protein
MKARFWRVLEHIFAALGVLAVLLPLSFYLYLRQHAMEPVPTRELGDLGLGQAALIATQGSTYKNAVVETLIQHLQEKSVRVRVLDISQLSTVDERDWDAIVLLHSWERWQPPPTVQDFVERLKERRKLVVLTTSGSGESRMACVDAVTSASELRRARGDAEELLGRVERVLETVPVSRTSP